MQKFRDGEIQILVSTSVVEVGVDIPNAAVMVIEGAHRFGLAQMHQFRGRVGRGNVKSYCLLIPNKSDEVENKRLKSMVESNDGFFLAERDLELRGAGDFLGTRQSGFSELKMADLTDVKLIENARNNAQMLFERDPKLESQELAPLMEVLNKFWDEGRGDLS
jgi:ATP-dependent DNA helicase RecG